MSAKIGLFLLFFRLKAVIGNSSSDMMAEWPMEISFFQQHQYYPVGVFDLKAVDEMTSSEDDQTCAQSGIWYAFCSWI